MVEGVSADLAQSGLPSLFWGEALAVFVHIWNRLLLKYVEVCIQSMFI
jgi:hypothetical protein